MASHPAQLVALSEGPNILLDKPILLIGRHQECDIQIPSRKISRRHCCIAQVDDHLVVRDLCSTNGIRVNGTRVNEGRIKPGDELTIGNFRYQVNWPAHGSDPGPAPGKLAPGKEDNMLESCDEPVPLAEAEPPQSLPVKPPFPIKEPLSLVFPESIQLVPLSDSQMNHPK
jgi:pSer/pThr/pTyr-binding forkhead associated (FHA) protein